MSQKNDAKNAALMILNCERSSKALDRDQRRALLARFTPWSADKIDRILQRLDNTRD